MKINLDLIPNNAIVAVALSGGRDSMALLHALLDENIKVKAICVEHGIRGDISKSECMEVKKYCDNLGVECKTYSVDAVSFAKENKLTIEQSARILRYDCFDRAIKDGFCHLIATAHHADDNAETVLMRILRGTGTKGLTGISKKRDEFIRPLLSVTREEIDEYVVKNSIKYFEDETNSCCDYTRNFIRHEILAKLKERFPSVVKSITRLSEIVSKDEEYFDALAIGKIVELGDAYGIKVEDITGVAIGERLIRTAFIKLGVLADIEERHIALIKGLAGEPNGTTLDMPYDTLATKEYDMITIYKKPIKYDYEIPLVDSDTQYNCGDRVVKVESVNSRGKGIFVDYDKVAGAVFRPKREGDIFKRYGGGTKSLGDYLTDIKYPQRLRDRLVVLAKDREIYAIVGVEISDYAKVTSDTTRIIKIGE